MTDHACDCKGKLACKDRRTAELEERLKIAESSRDQWKAISGAFAVRMAGMEHRLSLLRILCRRVHFLFSMQDSKDFVASVEGLDELLVELDDAARGRGPTVDSRPTPHTPIASAAEAALVALDWSAMTGERLAALDALRTMIDPGPPVACGEPSAPDTIVVEWPGGRQEFRAVSSK